MLMWNALISIRQLFKTAEMWNKHIHSFHLHYANSPENNAIMMFCANRIRYYKIDLNNQLLLIYFNYKCIIIHIGFTYFYHGKNK